MRLGPVVALLLLSSCVYVTRAEFDEHWDGDGDGWPIGEDCNDDHAQVFPWAPDWRGDGCDADCGKEPDSDGDDWPDAADCDPEDPDVFPCSPAEEAGDDVDHDCDGATTIRADLCDGEDPDFPDQTAVLSATHCAGEAEEGATE